MKECKAFGYAYDFELVSSTLDPIHQDQLNIEKLCSKN